MRRSAAEIINNLERRVARLERQARWRGDYSELINCYEELNKYVQRNASEEPDHWDRVEEAIEEEMDGHRGHSRERDMAEDALLELGEDPNIQNNIKLKKCLDTLINAFKLFG